MAVTPDELFDERNELVAKIMNRICDLKPFGEEDQRAVASLYRKSFEQLVELHDEFDPSPPPKLASWSYDPRIGRQQR